MSRSRIPLLRATAVTIAAEGAFSGLAVAGAITEGDLYFAVGLGVGVLLYAVGVWLHDDEQRLS